VSEPDGALDAARAFVAAVAWGEHRRVWDLLAVEGRKTVLRIALGRGMDEPLAGRLRDGRAGEEERDEYLADLVNGLRADLAGTDLDRLDYHLDEGTPAPGTATVVLRAPLPAALEGDGLPVGTLDLRAEPAGWRVERLVPHVVR